MWQLCKEFLLFLRQEKKWWLIPLVILLLILGAGIIFSSGSVLDPLMYPFMCRPCAISWESRPIITIPPKRFCVPGQLLPQHRRTDFRAEKTTSGSLSTPSSFACAPANEAG